MDDDHRPLIDWRRVSHLRDITVAIVALLIIGTQIAQWLGYRQTSPSDAVRELSAQLRRSDSLARQDISALTRATRVNTYTICLLSRRPQRDCENILIDDGIPRLR